MDRFLSQKLLFIVVVSFLLVPLMKGQVLAESGWTPKQNISLVTHTNPGSGSDLLLRALAEVWTKNNMIPTRVMVENVAGAGGQKAQMYVLHQNKGNEHMLMGYTPSQLNRPLLLKTSVTPRDFTQIAILVEEVLVLGVKADSPFKNFRDVIEAAKAKPQSVLQGGGAFGNTGSLVGKIISEATQAQFSYVPFKSDGEAVAALLGGHVNFMIGNPSEFNQHVASGEMRLLASGSHIKRYPNLKTFKDLGYNFRVLTGFRCFMAPPGISSEAVAYYVNLLDRTRKTADWQDYVDKNDLSTIWMSGQELETFLDEEYKTYARLNKELGLVKK